MSLNEFRVKFLQDKKLLEIGYTTVRVYLTLLNSTLKNGLDGKCYEYFTNILKNY